MANKLFRSLKKIRMIRRGSNNPNWGSIHRILDRVSVRLDRAAAQQEADRQARAAWEAQRAQERAEDEKAQQRAQKVWEAQRAQERAEDKEKQVAWDAQRAKERAENEKAQQKAQAAWQAGQDKARAAWEAQRAQERAEDKEKQDAWNAQRAKERAENEKAQQEAQAAWQAGQDKARAAWEAQRAQERAEDKEKQDAWDAQRAKERAENEKAQQEAQATWQAGQDKARAAWEAQRAQERAEDKEKQVAWDARRAKERREDREAEERREKDLAYLRQMIGGEANTVGKITEEFFYLAIENHGGIVIGEAKFDIIRTDQTYTNGKQGVIMQCDIILLNERYMAIVEIKRYLRRRDVTAFESKFREILPSVLPSPYRHLRLVPVMACMGASQRAQEQLAACGFALLQPDNPRPKVESEHLRVWPPVDQES